MSNINFTCPHCSFQKQLPASAVGMQGNCPSCKAVVTIRADTPENPSVLPQQPLPQQPLPQQPLPQQPLPQQPLPQQPLPQQPLTYSPKPQWSSYTNPVSNKEKSASAKDMLDSAGIADYGGNPLEKSAMLDLMEDKLAAKSGARQSDKSYVVAILLCLFFGPLGIHRFYLGHMISGLIQFLTFGCCWISSTLDLFLIIFRVLRDKDGGRLS